MSPGVKCSFQSNPGLESQSTVERLADFPQGQPAEEESEAACWRGSQG